VLGVIWKVKDGMCGDYWWVGSMACDTAWQVPHFAEKRRVTTRRRQHTWEGGRMTPVGGGTRSRFARSDYPEGAHA